MNLDKFFQSKSSKLTACAIGLLILLLFTFKVGMKTGELKARHSYRWAENYQNNFAGPRGGFMRGDWRKMPKNEFINAHGVFGEIIKIDLSADPAQASVFVIKDNDGVEKVVLAKEGVSIRRFRDSIKLGDLNMGDNVVVIGEPNDLGQIEAKLIRIMPAK